MATEYDDELSGVLFPERGEKKNERSPDFSGKATIDGTEYRVAGWKRKSRASGNPFISLAFSENVPLAPEDVDPDGALDLD